MSEFRKSVLRSYSPYSFYRNIKDEKHIELALKSLNDAFQEKISLEGKEFIYYYKKLDWDSAYFDRPIYKLFNVLFGHNDFDLLCKSVEKFLKSIDFGQDAVISIEIPAEDISLIQALGTSGFKLIESRLTYFNDNLNKHDYRRFKVRKAEKQDIPVLKEVARTMRNDFDRFHSDQLFDQRLADEYLATYIENSVNGFTDVIFVPNENNIPAEAFLTANYLKNDWEYLGFPVSKMVLSAVNTTCKGWYVKLVSEMTFHLREQGVSCIFMNTQSTNKAVIKTWESLGYKYGNCIHVLSKNLS